MSGRKYDADDYRFGFNGKENDNEIKGDGNQQVYGMRMYDPRLGKFLSVDPITNKYPMLTPYQFASNTPIQAIDIDGLEAWVVYNDYYSNKAEPVITIVFDEQLKSVPGAYVVSRWYNAENPNFVKSITWGTRNYSDFREMFPNKGKFERENGRPLVTFEASAKIVFGEVALDVARYRN